MKAIALGVAICAAVLGARVSAFDAQAAGPSAAVTKELVAAMTARQLDVIAAPDPAEPGRFVAAMAFPGVQMLVVSAKHPVPELAVQHLAKRQFREVYNSLQEGTATERLFFHDMGCDGLLSGADSVDVLYEGASTQTVFDGNWMAQSLTEAAYTQKYKQAEEQYIRAMNLLLAAVKKLPITTAG